MNSRLAPAFLVGFTFLAARSSVAHPQAPILLQIKPRTGDTLAVRLDQRVEMTGTPVECVASSGKAKTKLCSTSSRQMTTVTEVFSRAIVQTSSADGVTLLAVTDSIRTASSRGGEAARPVRVKDGDNTVSLRLSTDGGAEVIDSEASDEMRTLFGQMPAMLSRKPVSVGEKWTREMRIPITGESGAMGRVRATFRLDSLGDAGSMAYISMRGTLSHDHRGGSGSELGGSMNGSIQLDRRIGWIIQTRATIEVTSTVRRSPTSGPMRVRTKVTQLLRAGSIR
jgi:hypothetical protein